MARAPVVLRIFGGMSEATSERIRSCGDMTDKARSGIID
jgi:hypothetical protein